MTIKVNDGTMTSRQRVLNVFNFEKVDRVPVDYATNDAIHMRLSNYLGIKDGNMEKVRQALGVDCRAIEVPYIGDKLFEDMPNRITDPVRGFRKRYIANDSGGYWDFCDFPLQGADSDTIANFPVPNPDDFDYDKVFEIVSGYDGYALYCGDMGTCDVLNSTGMIMGVEDTLVNMVTEDEATLYLTDRRMKMQLAYLERIIVKAKGKIDYMWIGEDLGTQHSPMISLEMYRKVIRPYHQMFIDLAKSYNLPVMVHTCGSSSWVYEDFIEMGVHAVDTLQPEATNMSPAYLKEHFGGRLAFHGCISTAGALAYGSVQDVVDDVKNTLDILTPTNGYFLAPTHQIQDNTPVENIVAMYNTANSYRLDN